MSNPRATEPNKPLTPRQKIFAENYAISFDVTNSALKAGYSEKTAQSQGSQQLMRPNVKKYIDELLKDNGERNKRLKQKVITLLEEAISFNPTDLIGQDGTITDMRKLPGRLIEGFKPSKNGNQALMFSKQKATELLMRHLGMLNDKLDLTSKDEKIEIKFNSDEVAKAFLAANSADKK